MLRVLKLLRILLVLLPGLLLADEQRDYRNLIHIMSYLAKDYSLAVADGKILSEFEYAEQLEFANTALVSAEKIADSEIIPEVKELKNLISNLANADSVIRVSRSVQEKILSSGKLAYAPVTWPSIKAGVKLYKENCTSCHGDKGFGDGEIAKTMMPTPSNFHDPEIMQKLSPFAVFNTIKLGVDGTAMQPYSNLSDQQIWDLSFFILSLRHKDVNQNKLPEDLKLSDVASKSDSDLILKLNSDERLLASVRKYENDNKESQFLSFAITNLSQAKDYYQRGDSNTAKKLALSAYLEGIEPVEPSLNAVAPELMVELEKQLIEVRNAIEQGLSAENFAILVDQVCAEISKASSELINNPISASLAFAGSAGIIIREGFEAVLVILALLSVLRAVGASQAAIWVHLGWIAALGTGILTWFFSSYLLNFSGASREMIEAFASLFAVAVLLFFGFWLHSQTEISRWRRNIEIKVKYALRGNRLILLFLISFVAVFREAFETVLFLRAIWIQTLASSRDSILWGVLSAACLIGIFTYLILKFSVRLPIRKIFTFSAFVMAVLSVILAGKGIHALQETGLLVSTSLPVFRIDLIGFYPTLETIGFQLVIAMLGLFLWKMGTKPAAQ